MQEVFERIIAKLNKLLNHYPEDGTFLSLDDVMGVVKAEVEAYNNGWIPCSEKLPEETEKRDDIFDPITLAIVDVREYKASDLVLVTVRDYELDTEFTMDDMTVDGKWVNFESDGRYEVIAWQPLPQPYEPKEAEMEDNSCE